MEYACVVYGDDKVGHSIHQRLQCGGVMRVVVDDIHRLIVAVERDEVAVCEYPSVADVNGSNGFGRVNA